MRHQYQWICPDRADRSKILHRIIRDLAQRGRNRDYGDVSHQQRVTVRRRASDGFGGNRAAGTRSVLDDELLGKSFAQPLPDQAGDDVAVSACRKRDNDADRLLWPLLRLGRRSGRQCEAREEDAQAWLASHASGSLENLWARASAD